MIQVHKIARLKSKIHHPCKRMHDQRNLNPFSKMKRENNNQGVQVYNCDSFEHKKGPEGPYLREYCHPSSRG